MKTYLYIKIRNVASQLALGIVALAITGCNSDFLNLPPELNILDANMYDTPARILSHVNGLYSSAKREPIPNRGYMAGRYFVYNDIRNEDFLNRTNNGVTGLDVYQYNNNESSTQVQNLWIQAYLTINRVNTFLQGLEENPGVVSAELETNYRGEAKFVRAWMYYSLVHMFARPYAADNGASPGLPLRLLAESTPANNSLPRSTVAQIYQQIIQDLNEAEQELPDSYETATLNTTRAHKNTAIALKTRVYLAMADYPNVIAEANKITTASAPFTSPNRVAHALNAQPAASFQTPYTTLENIFSMPMSDNDAPGTQNQMGYYYNRTPNGNVEFFLNRVSQIADPNDRDLTIAVPGILNNSQWEQSDTRRTTLTSTATIGNDQFPILTKWSGVNPFIDWVPVIRYAEVLLNVAEAEAEVGNQARGLALLNAVRSRSYSGTPLTAASRQELVNLILTERRIELLGEGFRAPDAMRRLQTMVSVGAGVFIAPTASSYIFPIPVLEGETNSQIR